MIAFLTPASDSDGTSPIVWTTNSHGTVTWLNVRNTVLSYLVIRLQNNILCWSIDKAVVMNRNKTAVAWHFLSLLIWITAQFTRRFTSNRCGNIATSGLTKPKVVYIVVLIHSKQSPLFYDQPLWKYKLLPVTVVRHVGFLHTRNFDHR